MSKAPKKKEKKAGKKLRNLGQLFDLLSGSIPKATLIAAIEAGAAAAIAELKADPAESAAAADADAPKPKKKAKKKVKAKSRKEAAVAAAPEDSADSHE